MEVGRAVEALVDAREAQVGDIVDRPQLVEHGKAHPRTGDSRAQEASALFDPRRDLVELGLRHVATLCRCSEPTDHLRSIERLVATV